MGKITGSHTWNNFQKAKLCSGTNIYDIQNESYHVMKKKKKKSLIFNLNSNEIKKDHFRWIGLGQLKSCLNS